MALSMRTLCLMALVATVPAVPAGAQQANDPVIGQWTLDVAKSKSSTPGTALTSGNRMYEVIGGKLHSKGETVRADGTKNPYEFTGAYDGKDAPYTGSGGDRISMAVVNARTVDATLKRDGKVVQRTRREVSADGKTLTMTTTVTGTDGKPVTNVSVYTRATVKR
jgi:hypothetical protein